MNMSEVGFESKERLAPQLSRVSTGFSKEVFLLANKTDGTA